MVFVDFVKHFVVVQKKYSIKQLQVGRSVEFLADNTAVIGSFQHGPTADAIKISPSLGPAVVPPLHILACFC